MSGRWPTVPMVAEVKFLSGGTPRKSEASYWDGDIPWVSSGEMTQRRIYDTDLRVTEDGAENGTKLVPENTVLVVVRGMSLAKEFRISLTRREVTFNQDLKALKPSAKIDPSFLFYYLQSQSHAIRDSATEASHGTKKLELRVLEDWPLPLPDMAVQKNIAFILSAYDDLIENNRRRIQLLEQSARLLYKEWFVHLRFPGHEHVKIKDGVPEGWSCVALSELAEFINGFAFKPSHLGEEGLPIVKIPELKHGVTDKTPRNPGELIPEKYHLCDGDLLFSWSGTLAVNVWTSGPALLNQHLFNVVPKNRVGRAFLMCALRETLVLFENQTVGATMKHIRRSALDKVFLLLPGSAILSVAEEALGNIYQQLIALHKHNQKLAKARNLLLPRLMNGGVVV